MLPVSGSMSSIIGTAVGCTSALVKAISANGKHCALSVFDGNAYHIKDLEENMLDVKQELYNAFHAGGTSIKKGYALALNNVSRAKNRTRCVLVITDGDISSDDLTNLSIPRGVFPYFICISEINDPSRLLSMFSRYLKEGQYAARVVSSKDIKMFPEVFKKFIDDVLNR